MVKRSKILTTGGPMKRIIGSTTYDT